MEEKKLTDEEVIKALKNCSGGYGAGIVGNLYEMALDLIHRLQAENIGLMERVETLINSLHETIDKQKAELEELKSPKFGRWKVKFFKAQEEIERLTEENERLNKLLEEKRIDELNTAKQIVAQNCILNEENAELQKQVDEWKERAKIDLKNERNWSKIQIKQAVKDTAKEILQGLVEKAYLNECIDLTVNEVKAWFREDYGVEVE